jgi:hypothetical protein
MSEYPNSVKTFTNPVGSNKLSNPPHALQHENENDEITAIETELGLLPKGSSASVRARFDSLDTTIASLGDTKCATYVVATDADEGDYTDIQNAIDALPASGGSIFIKAGTYYITTSSGLNVTKSNVSLVGEGFSTILKVPMNVTGWSNLVEISGNNLGNITFQYLMFDGSSDSTVEHGYAININGSALYTGNHDIWIDHCYFYNIKSHNVVASIVTDLKMTNCLVENIGLDGIVMSLPTRNIVANNHFINCIAYGVGALVSGIDVTISNNQIDTATNNAIFVENTIGGTINNNLVTACGGRGIYLAG